MISKVTILLENDVVLSLLTFIQQENYVTK